jgi:molybdenum cofactor biosynthesis enzyme MoaA
MLKHMALLFLVSSCALFKGSTSLEEKNFSDLVDSIKLVGEGKGRLTLGQNQYVFGVDSVLNEDHEYIMAVSIPLHGEEVMILSDLRKVKADSEEIHSFEERISQEMRKLKLNKIMSTSTFHKELRSLIRFALSKDLKLNRNCKSQQNETRCTLDNEDFLLMASAKEFFIKKITSNDSYLLLSARNLTESIFTRVDISLHSKNVKNPDPKGLFSLELFW